LREKQIQQNYRPLIGIHKWFARRPGTLFRNLLLAEFNGPQPTSVSYWLAHKMRGIIADPFMGGGTTIFEANRLGFSVVGTDINPMAYWIVRQSLAPLDVPSFSEAANVVLSDVEENVGDLYRTRCIECDQLARVKYFLWVKTESCPNCHTANDLFPGYLVAEATRHPKHVLVCGSCGALNEYERQPTNSDPELCVECGSQVQIEGTAKRQRISCRQCTTVYSYPAKDPIHPPEHRMFALEYHCEICKPNWKGRFFKRPDCDDLARFDHAHRLLSELSDLPIPDNAIPDGDETERLHRWGYRFYKQMFNDRQLVGLGLLLRCIRRVEDASSRHALLTIFSDFLRYQNMLCRYDTYALKCQDIFSVHGFPVGLVQCEDNLLGIPRVGSGSFRHFIAKYLRAKNYCLAPFETRRNGKKKKEIVPISGETVTAEFVDSLPNEHGRQAYLKATSARLLTLLPETLDGVFTDPPYFSNVQYAELMDFCYSWLRLGLCDEFEQFRGTTTQSTEDLTGNVTLGRGLEHFTERLSIVFCHFASALKKGAPFVFTYHHNDPGAYVPLVVAILDARMDCTMTLPAAGEMSASLHISGTVSSILDSIFVCRVGTGSRAGEDVRALLLRDAVAMIAAGVNLTKGDVRCLAVGHIARIAVNCLFETWNGQRPLGERMLYASQKVTEITDKIKLNSLPSEILNAVVDNARLQEVTLAATV
jgi:adenine-specific DNA methylase